MKVLEWMEKRFNRMFTEIRDFGYEDKLENDLLEAKEFQWRSGRIV